jgi:glucose-like phosphotransferase system IIB component
VKLARKYPNAKVKYEEVNPEYLEAFGENNIVDVNMEMSRITVTVKDVDKVNAEKLKELGASGVLLVGNQVKCSFKENIENIYNTLKGNMGNE